MIGYLTTRGAIEYLDEHGGGRSRSSTPSVTAAYRAFAAEAAR